MTRLRGSGMAAKGEHIKRRKSCTALLEKPLHLFVIFGVACVMIGQLNLEGKSTNMDFDVPLPTFFFRSGLQVK